MSIEAWQLELASGRDCVLDRSNPEHEIPADLQHVICALGALCKRHAASCQLVNLQNVLPFAKNKSGCKL